MPSGDRDRRLPGGSCVTGEVSGFPVGLGEIIIGEAIGEPTIVTVIIGLLFKHARTSTPSELDQGRGDSNGLRGVSLSYPP